MAIGFSVRYTLQRAELPANLASVQAIDNMMAKLEYSHIISRLNLFDGIVRLSIMHSLYDQLKSDANHGLTIVKMASEITRMIMTNQVQPKLN